MGVVTLASVLWDANEKSDSWSRGYDETWALKLFNSFKRNLKVPNKSVLFTDRARRLPSWIEQIIDQDLGANGYGDCIRPFALNEPMIFAGLDTLVIGNCDKFARWCLDADRIALPKHPYEDLSINGVVFCPAGQRHIYDQWRGENDMKWLRTFPHDRIDNLWPGKVVSYKAHIRGRRHTPKARIVYFHGHPKPDEIENDPLVRQHWR